MKQLLLGFLALFFSTCTFSQEHFVFEQDSLKNVLQEIEQY
jgi:hypothetical protein